MTDDLKDRLQRLSQRAAERPSAFDQLERARGRRAFRRRIGAGVLAGVIAVAGTLTALRAFPGDDRLPLSTGNAPTTLTIWPEDPIHAGYGDPREVQAALDAGDESHAWRTDPRRVTERFAREFLGWEEVTLDALESVDHDDGTGTGATFAIASCSPDVVCDAIWQAVILVQPARQGDGGIWSVAAIQGLSNGSLDLGVVWNDPPSVLEGGSELAYRGDYVATVVGYVLSDGCRILSGADSNVSGEASAVITLPDQVASGPENNGCVDPAVGYVYAWQGERMIDVVDDPPFDADPLSHPDGYSLVTIVPVHADLILGDKASPSSAETYTDPLGWSLDHPAGWFVYPIDWFNGRYSQTGAAFSNQPLVPSTNESGRSEGWPDLSQLSPEGAVLIVTHRDGGPAPTIADDSSFPLQSGDAAILNAGPPLDRLLEFRGDGLGFSMVWGGYDDASQETRDALDEMIRTIRFEPWEGSDARNGFATILQVSPSGQGYPDSVAKLLVIYQMRIDGRTYVLDVPELNCEGSNYDWDAATQELLMESPCYPDVRYTVDGAPSTANPPGFQEVLAAHPTIQAWDGTLLVAVDVRQA
jgi:hypothetical protein